MIILGYPVNYEGDFGSLAITQIGRYKLVNIADTVAVPIDLAMIIAKAQQSGAQWLIVDPNPVKERNAFWFDTSRIAA